MAKYELIKETKFNGDIFYSISINGNYLSGSTSMNLETTQTQFDMLVKQINPIIEILETVEINEN